MLQQMRQNTKAILWVVVIAFVVTIFAVWGLDLQTGNSVTDPNVIGKVNGVPISRTRYQFAYQQFVEQLRNSSPDQSLSYAQEQYARTQAWDSIVYGIVTDQEIAALGITVNDQEIVDFLRTSPPPEIQQYFQNEQGQFDNQAYLTALNNPEIDWTSLEQLARERILRLKLNEYLTAQVHVSENEIRHAYQAETTEMSLAYVQFPILTADVGDYEPTAEEMNTYYEAHKADFVDSEKAAVAVVQIPLEPSATDLEDAARTARGFRDQIAAGEDFSELAKTYSEAPTSFVGGNTGFITRGQRDSLYFDALDAVEVGELTDVVKTEEGAYILRLIEKRSGEDTEYNVQELLITSILSRQTSDSLFALADELHDNIGEGGLEEAAAARGLEVVKPAPFPKGGTIENIGYVASIMDFAFANPAGAVSDLLRDEGNIYVVEVMERIPERTKPPEEVRDIVSQYVMMERRRSIAERDAQAFFQKARATDFATALTTYGMESEETGTFRAIDPIDPFGAGSVVADVGLAVAVGETAPPVEWRFNLIVANVLSRTEIDPEDYKVRLPQIRQQLLQQKAQAYAQSWYENKVAQAKIDDYRQEFGG